MCVHILIILENIIIMQSERVTLAIRVLLCLRLRCMVLSDRSDRVIMKDSGKKVIFIIRMIRHVTFTVWIEICKARIQSKRWKLFSNVVEQVRNKRNFGKLR